eukprot:13380607-Alexandrium_andersonii.AAC.1
MHSVNQYVAVRTSVRQPRVWYATRGKTDTVAGAERLPGCSVYTASAANNSVAAQWPWPAAAAAGRCVPNTC